MRRGEHHTANRRCGRIRENGFIYIAMLAAIAILGLAAAAYGMRVSDQVQREREQQLLRVGKAYAMAIADYYAGSPGTKKTFPPTIDDLLADQRTLNTVRHLREPYSDPMQPGVALGLILGSDGAIQGVYSTSTATPFHDGPIDLSVTQLSSATRYSDWQFIPKVSP
jgi:type II secretory pathway pseudopilin PulG